MNTKSLFIILFSIIHINTFARGAPIKEGEPFPKIVLPVPKDPDSRKYLGLSDGGTFQIQDIKSEILLIEIFNSGWAVCQREAPALNKIYRIIENNAKLKGKIKIIGIGAKDDIYYVDYFKKNFKIKFPLFPDEDRVVHELVGEPPTPYFIIVKLKGKGGVEILHTHLGKIPPADEFINLMIEKSGLKLWVSRYRLI